MFCSLHSPDFHAYIKKEVLRLVPGISSAITEEGKRLLELKYLLPNESLQDRLSNSCSAFASNVSHAERLAYYLSQGWFMFATPLLANGGTSRGLPISCFLLLMEDSLDSIGDSYKEMMYLSALGGGLGTTVKLRSKGMPTSKGSETTGVIPYIKVAESITLATQQGLTRRGAQAIYLNCDHPEIIEFLSLRDATGGDINRRAPYLHLGVNVTHKLKRAVRENLDWELIDPNSKQVVEVIKARYLWSEILKCRMEQRGEPYLFFIDDARDQSPYTPEDAKDINGSNLCTEIVEVTSTDKTAVCGLSSANAAKCDEWCEDPLFISDLVEMLDNVLQVFVNQAPEYLHKAKNSITWERSIGLGLMGLAEYKQSKNLLFSDNCCLEIQKHIHKQAVQASEKLGISRGIPEAALHLGRRNTNLIAIAPNASSSIMLGTSPGIEPYKSNCFSVKQGELLYEFRNPSLKQALKEYGEDTEETWEYIKSDKGSVQNLNYLTPWEKEKFQTASEIDQLDIVRLADQRQPYVCQAQSLNLFFDPEADPRYVNKVHLAAMDSKVKSLYYCKTSAIVQIKSTSVACPIDPIERAACVSCEG